MIATFDSNALEKVIINKIHFSLFLASKHEELVRLATKGPVEILKRTFSFATIAHMFLIFHAEPLPLNAQC